MRTWQLLAVVAVAFALTSSGHHDLKRYYLVYDQTTWDVNDPYCDNDTWAVEAKCSSDSQYTLLEGTNTLFTCPETATLDYVDHKDDDLQGNAPWTCTMNPTHLPAGAHVDRVVQRVNITGTRYCREGIIAFTATPSCQYQLSYP